MGQSRLWTQEEDTILLELRQADYNWPRISSYMDRTISACETRYHYLMKHRNSQYKKPKPEPKRIWSMKDNKADSDPIFNCVSDYIFTVQNEEGRDPYLDRLVQVYGSN